MLQRLAIVGLILVGASGVAAQQQVTLPPPKSGTLANLTRVMVPETRNVALGEAQSVLAFCHDLKYPAGHVSLVKLDAKGNPAPYAISWKIPHSPALVKHPNFAISAAFHPKLPLLYVWQDLNIPYSNSPPATPAELMTFDHLHIYSLAKEPPELIASLCRGPQYQFGFSGGQVHVDAAAEHLYVPNLREVKNPGVLIFGRFKLDPDGLPFIDDAQAKQPAAVRVKALSAANPAPQQICPIDYVYLFPMNPWGAGHSFIPMGKDAILSSSHYGAMTWRPNDKPFQMYGLPLRTRGNHLLCAHPALPAVFATAADTDSFNRFEQSDGFVTGLPRQYTLEKHRFTSAPAVLPKQKLLAIGGQHHVYVFSLDDLGYPALEATKVHVFNPEIRALVYSEKFDRLYVGAELSK